MAEISRASRVGIMGGGVLGKAVAAFFHDALVYDKYVEMDQLDSVIACDIIFVCVPTPYDDGFDSSALDDVFQNLKHSPAGTTVVIKSTVIPGTTQSYQEQNPHLRVLFNPEFLTEKTSIDDFLHPDKQLVGFTPQSKEIADDVLSLLPNAPYKKTMPAAAAELVKYAVNTFYATKVVFGNTLYDIAESIGVDYELVKEAFVSDKRITDSHFDIWHGGYRGYGGKCLPKDLLALRDIGKEHGVDVSFFDTIHTLNQRYTSHQQNS